MSEDQQGAAQDPKEAAELQRLRQAARSIWEALSAVAFGPSAALPEQTRQNITFRFLVRAEYGFVLQQRHVEKSDV